MNDPPILSLEVGLEEDVVLARQRARQVAALLGFDPPDQTRIATSTSEIARNAVQHAGRGRVEFLVDPRSKPPMLLIRVRDHGPGIDDVRAVLDGRAAASRRRGRGIQAARRLMDRFEIDSTPARGTVVMMAKALPHRAAAVTPETVAHLADELARLAPRRLVEEVRQQNQELLRALDELRDRQAELSQINRELEETNRGVVALYAELDEKANSLLRASELKTRFLSNMSHEFRSPLNSIVRLSGFLLDRSDGDLSSEQEKQVTFIRKSAVVLSEMVNDLLDLAKVEAGKVVVRPETFEVADLFRTLRGMIRPLLTTEAVALVFDEPTAIPPLWTDEGKVAQILRNFLSNAVKFTERGEIRVRAEAGPGDSVELLGLRHRHRDRRGGPGADLRGVRPGRGPDPVAGQGDRPGPAALAAAGRAARRLGLGPERAGGGFDLHRLDPSPIIGGTASRSFLARPSSPRPSPMAMVGTPRIRRDWSWSSTTRRATVTSSPACWPSSAAG